MADAEVAEKLFKRATGYSHLETKFATHEGKITDSVEYTKNYAPDTVGLYLLVEESETGPMEGQDRATKSAGQTGDQWKQRQESLSISP